MAGSPPRLPLRVGRSFEVSRLEQQQLALAYEQALPPIRRVTRPRRTTPPGLVRPTLAPQPVPRCQGG
jgi:hypothetical protein